MCLISNSAMACRRGFAASFAMVAAAGLYLATSTNPLHAQELKEVVAEQALELRLLKKSMIADGGDEA